MGEGGVYMGREENKAIAKLEMFNAVRHMDRSLILDTILLFKNLYLWFNTNMFNFLDQKRTLAQNVFNFFSLSHAYIFNFLVE